MVLLPPPSWDGPPARPEDGTTGHEDPLAVELPRPTHLTVPPGRLLSYNDTDEEDPAVEDRPGGLTATQRKNEKPPVTFRHLAVWVS